MGDVMMTHAHWREALRAEARVAYRTKTVPKIAEDAIEKRMNLEQMGNQNLTTVALILACGDITQLRTERDEARVENEKFCPTCKTAKTRSLNWNKRTEPRP